MAKTELTDKENQVILAILMAHPQARSNPMYQLTNEIIIKLQRNIQEGGKP